ACGGLPSLTTRRSSDLAYAVEAQFIEGHRSERHAVLPSEAWMQGELLRTSGPAAATTKASADQPAATSSSQRRNATTRASGSSGDRKSTRLNSSHVKIS